MKKLNVLIVVLVCIAIVLVFKIKLKDDKKVRDMNKPLKVAINLDNLVLPIDPLKNTTLSNAFITNHLYSGLIEETDDGNYAPDLCNSFEWVNEEFICDFKDDSPVDAEDSKASLIRSIVNSKNDHANLKHIICDKTEDEEKCLERIYVKDKKLIIQVKEENKRPLLISILASINLKIIPNLALSKNDSNSQIIDYTKTSGYYHVTDNNFNILYATERLLKKYPDAPKSIVLINAKSSTLNDLIDQDQVDVISTTVPVTEKIATKLADNKWNIFETYPISVGLVVFGEKAISNSDPSERFYVASKIIAEIQKLNLYKSQPTQEFIQFFGQGYLSDSQKSNIAQKKSINISLKSSFKLGVSTPSKWQPLAEELPNLIIVKSNQNAVANSSDDTPDIVLLTNDVSFDNNFSFFAFAVNHGLFGKTGHSKSSLISEFANQPDAESRIKYINELHYNSLADARIVPIFASPYFTAAKADLKVKLSKYNSRTLLWKISSN